MTKALKKVIIHKSIVKNVYHKSRTNEQKQKNLCVHFLQKAKEIFPKTTCKTIIG